MPFIPVLVSILGWLGRFLIGEIFRRIHLLLLLLFAKNLLTGVAAGGISFAAFQLLFNALKSKFYDGYNSLPYELVSLLDIGGFKEGFGILFGAMTARMAMNSIGKVFEKV